MSKELAIIDLIARLSGQTEALADDAFWDASTRQVYTTDMLVENRHFSMNYFSPQDLGWKAAAVNISDVAGMGCQLKYLLVSLGLPETLGLDFVQQLYEGLQAACNHFGGVIIGGDTVSSDCITLNVTAIGYAPQGCHVGRRFQARPGDWIIASGFHGLSKVGLNALQQQWPDFKTAKAAHLRPMPRIEAGLTLARKFERYALMDTSDGLADALIKLAQGSQQILVAEARKIHLHPEVLAYSHKISQESSKPADPELPLHTALYGGEDFELVATVPEVDAEVLAHFHVIGRVASPDETTLQTPGAWLIPVDSEEPRLLDLGHTYQHFQVSHEPA